MDGSALQHNREVDLQARSAELVVDDRRILIAHDHVHSVEPILDVRIESDHGQALGTLQLGEDQWPVYCLDGDLNILDKLPAKRCACVLLRSDRGAIGILCDQVRVVDNAALTLVPVPACMSGEQSLVESLAVMDGKVSCVLGADRLSAMLLAQTTDDSTQATPSAAGEQ